MICKCGEKTFVVNNISTGQIIYTCPKNKYIWDKDTKEFIKNETDTFCNFKKIEGEIKKVEIKEKTNNKIKKDKKNNFSTLQLKVNIFKRCKTLQLYECINFLCKDLRIKTFEDWENDDLGDYCEFLLKLCNCDDFTLNYYKKLKNDLQIKLENVQLNINEIDNYFKEANVGNEVYIDLENLQYCKNILNKQVSHIRNNFIHDLFNKDKQILNKELDFLNENKNKLNDEITFVDYFFGECVHSSS